MYLKDRFQVIAIEAKPMGMWGVDDTYITDKTKAVVFTSVSYIKACREALARNAATRK